MKASLRTASTVISISALLASSLAFADGWPDNVTGSWNIIGNNSSGVLTITQYPGIAGNQCKPIDGTIFGADNIQGFYCPNSGHIAFLRYVGNTSNPRQWWSGSLSQATAPNIPLKIGGYLAAFIHDTVTGTVGGSLGEYNFSATHQ